MDIRSLVRDFLGTHDDAGQSGINQEILTQLLAGMQVMSVELGAG